MTTTRFFDRSDGLPSFAFSKSKGLGIELLANKSFKVFLKIFNLVSGDHNKIFKQNGDIALTKCI